MTATTGDVLRWAADYIAEKPEHWQQHKNGWPVDGITANEFDGPVCMRGGIYLAEDVLNNVTSFASERLYDVICQTHFGISNANDDWKTTRRDCIRWLREAAELADKGETT